MDDAIEMLVKVRRQFGRVLSLWRMAGYRYFNSGLKIALKFAYIPGEIRSGCGLKRRTTMARHGTLTVGLGLFAALALIMVTNVAWAAGGSAPKPTEGELQQKTLFQLPKLGSVFVQFRPIVAPINLGKRGVRNGPVTVLVTVAENEQIGRLCDDWARINNALLAAWFKKPVDLAYLRTDEDDLVGERLSRYNTKEHKAESQRLISMLNRSLRQVEVTEIRVYKGSRRGGAQGSLGKLPFSQTCTLWVRKTPEQMREERAEAAAKTKGAK